MKFHSLKISNLFSIGEAILDLRDRGLLLVNGYSIDDGSSNGSGKTSLTSKAITWCLFGKTINGTRANDVVHKKFPKKESFAQLQFSIGSETYLIRRQRNPNKLLLLTESMDLSARSEQETQNKINLLIGKSFETFCYTDFFGHGIKKDFLEQTSGEQFKTFLEILPIFNQIDDWKEEASTNSKLILKQLEEYHLKVMNAEGQLSSAETWLADQISQRKEWAEEHKVKVANVKKAKIQNENLRNNLQTKLGSYVLHKLDDGVIVEYNNIKGTYETYCNTIIKTDKEIANLEYSISENKKCPTCFNPLVDTKGILKTLEYRKDSLEKYKKEKSRVELSLEEAKENLQNYKIKKEQNEQISQEMHKLASQINALKNNEIEYDIILKETNPFTTKKIKEVRQFIKEIKSFINSHKKHKEKLKKELQSIKFWENAFSKDLKLLFINKILSFLEKESNLILQQLEANKLRFDFSTTKQLKSGDEKFDLNLNVFSTTGGEGFSNLSGGEQQLVNFAFGIALSRLAQTQASSQSNLLILDEPFSLLSEENYNKVVQYLTLHMKEKSTILLISNDPGLKGLVPNSIMVEKINGISSIKEEY